MILKPECNCMSNSADHFDVPDDPALRAPLASNRVHESVRHGRGHRRIGRHREAPVHCRGRAEAGHHVETPRRNAAKNPSEGWHNEKRLPLLIAVFYSLTNFIKGVTIVNYNSANC